MLKRDLKSTTKEDVIIGTPLMSNMISILPSKPRFTQIKWLKTIQKQILILLISLDRVRTFLSIAHQEALQSLLQRNIGTNKPFHSTIGQLVVLLIQVSLWQLKTSSNLFGLVQHTLDAVRHKV